MWNKLAKALWCTFWLTLISFRYLVQFDRTFQTTLQTKVPHDISTSQTIFFAFQCMVFGLAAQ